MMINVLAIKQYRSPGVVNFRGKNLQEIKEIPPLSTFHPKHEETVNTVLHRENLTTPEGNPIRDFGLIHWRAEKKGMDYVRCAKLIAKSRDLMSNGTETKPSFFIMTSLNSDPKKMWSEARKEAANSNAPKALQMLTKEYGFLHFSELIAKNGTIDDSVDVALLLVWDLILAEKASSFATCTGNCRNKLCKQCNYLGSFAMLAIWHRESKNKQSMQCWPS